MKFYQSRNYCFTDFELLDIKAIYEKNKHLIRYICRGVEICPKTKKKHHQGWIQLYNKKTVSGVKKIFNCNKIHLESCRGDEYDNNHYCKKEQDFISFGTFITQGHRSDLQQLMNDIKEGKSDFEICEKEPEKFKNNMKFINTYRKLLAEEINKQFLKENYSEEVIKLNKYQETWKKHLQIQNDRQITWIVDYKGGKGKTFFSKCMLANYNAIRFTNAKSKNIAYAYNYEELICFDFSRCNESFINYGIIEDLKNGLLFSSKYESKNKIFKIPKIIVMSNFYPDTNKLSSDRWDIIEYPESVILENCDNRSESDDLLCMIEDIIDSESSNN